MASGEVDVGGLDIPVQIVEIMYRFQAIQQRHKQLFQLVLVEPVWSLSVQMTAEVVTLLVLHDHVARPICLKVIKHFDNIFVVHPGENIRFPSKHPHRFNEVLLVRSGLHDHVTSRIPDYVIGWKQLFDGHPRPAAKIPRRIRDAEGAGVAEHLLELVDIQNVSRR